MNVGFTGTQYGLTVRQMTALLSKLQSFYTPGSWFLHGDCVGGDMEACILASKVGYKIWVFPPIEEAKRAFCLHDRAEPKETYLARNRKIVDNSDVMIACPKTPYEILRSGTWSTIRYAKKLDKPIEIIYPH